MYRYTIASRPPVRPDNKPAGPSELTPHSVEPVRGDRWPAARPRPTARRRARARVPLLHTRLTIPGATAANRCSRAVCWHRTISIANIGGNGRRRHGTSNRGSWGKMNTC